MEIWKKIAGYDGLYEVSSLGNVRALSRTIINKNGIPQSYPTRILKWDITKHVHTSYARVTLCKDHTTDRQSVHRLVAIAFIPNPEGKECVNHKDNNALNNAVDNLEWCTHAENMLHAQRQGRLFPAQSTAGKVAGKNKRDELEIRFLALVGTSIKEWTIISANYTYANKVYKLPCRCSCGYTAMLDWGRLRRQEVGACNECAQRNRTQNR